MAQPQHMPQLVGQDNQAASPMLQGIGGSPAMHVRNHSNRDIIGIVGVVLPGKAQTAFYFPRHEQVHSAWTP